MRFAGWRAHIAPTLRLAVPVMFARAGALVIVAVDAAMSGHAGSAELAHYGLASAPQVPLMLVGIGLLLGIVILTAQLDGAGSGAECGAVWRVGLVHAAAYGVVLGLLCQVGEEFLLLTGQAPELAHGGGRVLALFGWGMPGMLLFIATIFFLEGIHRPLPGMAAMLCANLLNAGLNWVFIYGHWGFTAMGAEGAALATTLVRWFLFLFVAAYVLLRVDRDAYGILRPITELRALGRRMRRLGYPMALGHGLESSAFSTMTLFAGLLGAAQVASYTIAMNLVALVFMLALGFSTAAGVRVANHVGRGDAHGLRLAGWVAVAIAALVLGLVSLVFANAPGWLAAWFSRDAAVVTLAASTILVAALALVPDGLQAVLIGALRGLADVWPATLILMTAFWGVMVPLGYWLAVAQGGGAPMLMLAVFGGALVAAVSLALRFVRIVSARAVGTAR